MTKITTYTKVADAMGLEGIIKERYVKYMKTRWSNDEDLHCKVGYAQEWARRFQYGIEYSASDLFGQIVLDKIYKEENE